MANWAYTCYAIEGPKEVLQKIEQAILHPSLEPEESDGWEGGVLRKLGMKEPNNSKKYLRGFIREDVEPWYDSETGALRFEAEEAWGLSDLDECLEELFPNIKVFYVVEESGCEVYATNDSEGKYFKDRFYVDTCIDGQYQSEYFTEKEAVYEWLKGITNGRVTTPEEVDAFNDKYEGMEGKEENWISIHEFDIT